MACARPERPGIPYRAEGIIQKGHYTKVAWFVEMIIQKIGPDPAKRQDTTLDQDRIQGKFQSPGYSIQGALARVGSKAQSGGPHTRPKGSEVALQRGKIAKMPKCVQNLLIFFGRFR